MLINQQFNFRLTTRSKVDLVSIKVCCCCFFFFLNFSLSSPMARASVRPGAEHANAVAKSQAFEVIQF